MSSNVTSVKHSSVKGSPDRLDSWKEIANYLSRDTRTVHRWEKNEGLPVHRHMHSKRATVWARRSELDRWKEHRRARSRERSRGSAVTSVGRGSTTEKMMLAVLPFENLTGDPQQEYFSDGFTEEMISRLARFGEERLGVIARTSVMQYKGTQKSVERIGRELGVDYVLEGSVRRAARRVRITAQLIAVRDQSHVWADTYERDLRDILGLQSEVTAAIADRIRLKMPLDAPPPATPARPVRPDTYEACLKGMFYRNRFTSEGFENALSCFRRAAENDPLDPLSWAGLALSYAMVSHSDLPARQPEEAFGFVKDAAMKALALDDSLAEAHVAIGTLKLYYEWDWEAAEAALVRAFTLNPHLAEAHRHFGWYQFLIGRQTDALAALTRAKQVEPLVPLYTAELAWLQLVLGQFEKATAGAIESLHLNAEFPIGLYVLGCVALEQGRYDEALRAHRHAVAVSPGWKWALGYTCARAGLSREAHQTILECGDVYTTAFDGWTHDRSGVVGMLVGEAFLGIAGVVLGLVAVWKISRVTVPRIQHDRRKSSVRRPRRERIVKTRRNVPIRNSTAMSLRGRTPVSGGRADFCRWSVRPPFIGATICARII